MEKIDTDCKFGEIEKHNRNNNKQKWPRMAKDGDNDKTWHNEAKSFKAGRTVA